MALDNTHLPKMALDNTHLPNNISSSQQANAVLFRRHYARASNAIEGVILSQADMAFIDNINPNIDKKAFKTLVLEYINTKRNLNKPNSKQPN